MDRRDVSWCGYWPAVPTPFLRTGELDEGAFRNILTQYLSYGVHGMLVNGSSGEWFSQSIDERKAVAQIAVHEIRGRVPVVICCTALTAADVCELAKHAKSVGADGIMISAPPYMRPAPEEVTAFVRRVSDSIPIPIMVYNVPRRVGVDLTASVIVRLAAVPNVVALKNSVSDEQFFETLTLTADTLRVFGGNFFSAIGIAALAEVGGDGYIGGWELLGADLPGFFDAAWAGDSARAREIAVREKALDRQLWDESNRPRFGRSFQSQLKAGCNLLGMSAGYPRFPLLPLDTEELAALGNVLKAAGLVLVEAATV